MAAAMWLRLLGLSAVVLALVRLRSPSPVAAHGRSAARGRWLQRLRARLPGRRGHVARVAGLALGLELWAAALSAGVPVVAALEAASGGCDPPLSDVFLAVAAQLRAGTPTRVAWEAALTRAGVTNPTLAAAGRAAVRSERDGTGLERVLLRLAADERAETASRGLAAARRAAVWAVLPLGLCSLPAYVLLGVVPAVLGLLGRLR